MNTTLKTTLITAFVAFTVMAAFGNLVYGATSQDDGRTYFSVKDYCINQDDLGTYGRATGQITIQVTDGIYVKDGDEYDDGAFWELALSVAWIEANVSGVSDEKVKVSADDTTSDYLGVKLTGGDGLTGTEVNPGGNETFDLDVNVGTGMAIVADDVAFTGTYTTVSGNDGATDVTGAELETMSAGSDASALHYHRNIDQGGGTRGTYGNLVGLINGANQSYDTTGTFVAARLEVYMNGVIMLPDGDDYTVTDTDTFSMTVAPPTGSVLLAIY